MEDYNVDWEGQSQHYGPGLEATLVDDQGSLTCIYQTDTCYAKVSIVMKDMNWLDAGSEPQRK